MGIFHRRNDFYVMYILSSNPTSKLNPHTNRFAFLHFQTNINKLFSHGDQKCPHKVKKLLVSWYLHCRVYLDQTHTFLFMNLLIKVFYPNHILHAFLKFAIKRVLSNTCSASDMVIDIIHYPQI